jgi:23S rRNA G2445 N2-methylase RlmL
MFDAIKNVAERMMSGSVDSAAVKQAVGDHLDSVGNDQLADHLQTAAFNLQDSGQTEYAQQATVLVEQIRSNPAEAKDAVVAFIQGNPQLLQHFSPEFVQGIASKLGL